MSPAKPDQRPHGIEALSSLCEDLLQRAIWAIHLGHDRERRYLAGPRSCMPTPALSRRDAVEEWGADAVEASIATEREIAQERARHACPYVLTKRDYDQALERMDWLTWLGAHRRSRKDVIIIVDKTLHVAISKTARKVGLDPRTVKSRYERAFDLIAAEKWQEILALS